MINRLFIAAELAAQFDRTEHAAYWAALRAADRLQLNLPGISREAMACAIAGEMPGGFQPSPETWARIFQCVPEVEIYNGV